MSTTDSFGLFNYQAENIVILCGAGISNDFPTCIPTVDAFLKEILNSCGANKEIINSMIENKRTTYRFEYMIEEICKLGDNNQKITQLFNSPTYNKNHSFLSNMIRLGATVLTTNFDNCIENTNEIKTSKRLVFTGEDIDRNTFISTSMLIKIHGSNPLPTESNNNNNMVITLSALSSTANGYRYYPHWRELLLKILNDKILVVLGYSGSDDFDITPLLQASKPQKVLWFDYFPNKNGWPRLCNKSKKSRIENLRTYLPLQLYMGNLVEFISYVSSHFGFQVTEGSAISNSYSINQYILEMFPSEEQRVELLNQILLSSTLYEKVLSPDCALHSEKIILQRIKAHYLLSNYDQASILIDMHEDNVKSYENKAELYYYKSAILFYKGRIDDALQEAKTYCKYIRKNKDNAVIAHANNHLAAIKFSLGQTNKANNLYKKALRLSKKYSIEAEATALWGLADMQATKENYHTAISYYQRAEQLFLNIGKNYSLGYIARNTAESHICLIVHQNDEHVQAAKRCLCEAKRCFSYPRNDAGILYVNISYIKFNMKLNKYTECYSLFEESFEIVKINPNIPLIKDLHEYYKKFLSVIEVMSQFQKSV